MALRANENNGGMAALLVSRAQLLERVTAREPDDASAASAAARSNWDAAGAVWRGKWCWTHKHLTRPWNYYAYFRKTVDLPGPPRRALVRISADARYTLYVNGQRVHQGPARSFVEHQSYDTLDLTELLHAGRNVICAVCHQFGIPTFISQYRAISGFLVDGVIEMGGGGAGGDGTAAEVPLHTPDGWTCRDAKGWRRDVMRLSVQLGFQEHFDADADPLDWMSQDFAAPAADGWHEPWVAGPVGVHPWLNTEPRGVPLLADHVESFKAITGQFRGENARGYKIADDVYHLPLKEPRHRDKALIEHGDRMLCDDGELAAVPPPQDDAEFVMAVLDLGEYRTGHIMLDIAEAAGDEIIDIIYSEVLDKSGGPLIVGQAGQRTVSEEATADRYRCRPGAQKWEAFHYKGMRYATLIFRNLDKPLKIRHVALRQVHAAVDAVGSFDCSDSRLNEIWQVARRTQLNCLFDSFVDCPWREQAQWWGDARVQSRVTAYAFGDVSILERGIRQMAQSQAADGSLHSHPPADLPLHRLPDFMMTWVGSLWDYYFHTGRVELITECLSVLHRLMRFFESHEVTDGLIGSFEGWWVFLDWQSLRKTNFSGVLNLMYLQSLRWAAALCQIVGDAAAGRYHLRAQRLESNVEQYFWDANGKVWRDGFDPEKNQRVSETSQHMNALAILLRLKPQTHVQLARDVLLKSARSPRSRVLCASPFFYAYVLEALADAGYRNEVIELIREKWGVFLDRGATTFWENWDAAAGSYCHAWSASPLYHLTEQVLGVCAVEVGWRRVRIAPVPAGLDFAKGTIPTPLGLIRVDWEKGGEDQLAVRVDLPEGMEADFISPLGETRVLGSGNHEFHT